MNKHDLIRLRSKIVAILADLEVTIGNARVALKNNVEMAAKCLQDECDAAKGELDMKNILKVHNHTIVQREIHQKALARMETDSYGKCLSCEEEIGLRRLEAMPSATLCIDCQSGREGV